MKEEVKVFKEELKQIKNPKILKFTIDALELLPDYFWKIPASSTSKYHPPFARGDGGLVRHTQCAVRLAINLFRFTTLTKRYSEDDKDMIISAILLHDGAKLGLKGGKYTVTEHPLVVASLIEDDMMIQMNHDKEMVKTVCDLIRTHMSEWNKDYKTGKEVLPLPTTHKQMFVALCDYLSAFKAMDFHFDVEVDRDAK